MTDNRKTILVTGGTGFLGRHVMAQLEKAGFSPVALLRPQSVAEDFPWAARRFDGTADGLDAVFDELAPLGVIHTAGCSKAPSSGKQTAIIVDANVTYGATVMDAAARAGCEAFVTIGTYWQYATDGNYAPTNLYAVAKEASFRLLDQYHRAGEMKTLSLVLYDTFGERDPRQKLLGWLADAARSGEPFQATPGDQHMYLIHVEDAARGVVLGLAALLAGDVASGQVYAVRCENSISVKTLVALLEQAWNIAVPVSFGARGYPPRQIMQPWAGPLLPGFRCEVDLKEGLKRLWEPSDRDA